MKVLHTSDWHIGQFKGPVVDGVNLRSQDTVKCLDFMIEKAREEEPDLICVSGDIFHQEQIGPVRYSDEMVTATRVIEQLAETTKLVVVMRGTPNHDGSGQFKVLEKMMQHNKKVVVVAKPQVLHTPIADIACIPGFDKQEFRSRYPGLSADEENNVWTHQISQMVLGLRAQCSADKPSILMAHYTVPGCNMESGQTSFFANFEPVIPREALQAAHYEAVFLGHIHRPQVIEGLHNVFYSGAINAMNFNDEDQSRGFWLHNFLGNHLENGNMYTTPYRLFKTLRLEQEEIADYLKFRQAWLIEKTKEEDITDCIVRVLYSCTAEQKKALNIPALQADLYACGAFYVSSIESESTIEVTNKGLLSEESDPLKNLNKWLEEKCVKDTKEISDLAEPIISAALSSQTISDNHGVFRPISICVKNYRNYKEEFFDFSNISFCSINGVNGAGKSSLFMDAIMDCLYEETREGDCKAWIRGSEDARSGMIEFVFDIGEKRFRVVRTRAKSGKTTLNISQKSGENDWMNLSAERIRDTQAEIEKVLGMDSMTFRSCALIMQDQYGLFLQAKKDERMAILGSLLGLGVYSDMEQEARKRLADSKKELMSLKESSKIKHELIEAKGNPEEEILRIESVIRRNEKKLDSLKERKNVVTLEMAMHKERLGEIERISAEVQKLTARQKELAEMIDDVSVVISDCDNQLKNAELVRKGAEQYRQILDKEISLSQNIARYNLHLNNLDVIKRNIEKTENSLLETKVRNAQIEKRLAEINMIDTDVIENNIADLEAKNRSLQEEVKKKSLAVTIEKDIAMIKSELERVLHGKQMELEKEQLLLASQKKQKDFIADSRCFDIEKATCVFLQNAKSEAVLYESTQKKIAEIEHEISQISEMYENRIKEKIIRLESVGYSPNREKELLQDIENLSPYLKQKEQLESIKMLFARLEADKASNDKMIGRDAETLAKLKLEASELTKSIDSLTESVAEYQNVIAEKELLKCDFEKEKNFPVYEERRKNAYEKKEVLEKEYDGNIPAITELNSQLFDAKRKLEEVQISEDITLLEAEMQDISKSITELQIEKGAWQQKAEDVCSLRKEVEDLAIYIEREAEKTVRYEVLKQAFSQDGVPHQIVRNIIPYITDTANSILGQMTGGTMGVEFVMERIVKGRDGDKATLDVLINEYGKTTLPYASKSGGEKVKASLAVILALSEIKATAAGIQLGMLFIDEPPFLDSEGAQAYVDSLETIRNRYPDVKVMAITHDDAMKARFSQSITVIKTEDGSKVIY